MKRLTIEERLAAAAWRILNDGHWHSAEARAWAREQLKPRQSRPPVTPHRYPSHSYRENHRFAKRPA